MAERTTLTRREAKRVLQALNLAVLCEETSVHGYRNPYDGTVPPRWKKQVARERRNIAAFNRLAARLTKELKHG